jgi:quercetin dioxygenase-like cupin family protein
MLSTETNPTYELHAAERVTVRHHSADRLEVAAEWAPAEGAKPLPHLHPAQDERFTILAGELTIDLDGTRHVLRAGDVLEVPRGTTHRMWNSGDGAARATWETMPALRTAEFWATVHEARKVRPTDGHGMLRPLAAAPILREFRDVFRLAVAGPAGGPAVAALALVGRLRGYGR